MNHKGTPSKRLTHFNNIQTFLPNANCTRYNRLTRFLVLSLRKGRMTVYRAWMYHGWFTKWMPPNLAGKLSWRDEEINNNKNTCITIHHSSVFPQYTGHMIVT